MTTTVNDIEHIESQTLRGTSIVKVFFQPGAKTESAVAQITSISQSALRNMPPGTTPPFIITYNASTVPILQLGLSGNGLSEQQLYDFGVNFIRVQLATVQGASIPNPYGGKQAQIQVDLDPRALQAKGLSPTDVVNAIALQNLILPGGTSKIGGYEYDVRLHGSPDTVEELNDLPIKMGDSPIYIRDVAHVRNGFPPQTNIVRVNGQRAALLSVIKSGAASTLDIIDRVKEALPRIAASLPPELQIKQLADQSVFVRAAIDGRGARGGDRRLPHGDHDPRLPRQLAQHDHHRGLDPALDPDLDHRAQRARRDDQHHDARRPGARGRHPGRRRDGGDREHQLAPGAGQGARAGDPRRRRADRHPGVRLDALHLHRVRADVLPHRRRALSVRADGRGGGVRDARVVRAVADAGADDGEVPAEGAPAARARRVAESLRARAAGARRRLRAPARHLPLDARAAAWRSGVVVRDRLPARLRRVRPRCCPTSARTSFRRSTAASSSCTCARRPARGSRKPRRCATPSTRPSATSSRRRRSRASSTTSGCPTAA